ncbi:MAG: oxalate:formate antiporter [Oscillospiraceae bacterium]|jgi:predicted nucleotidyltransferase|nr:oxalate:formate antiporter [Oscillospiraceae bacterium]
MITGAQQSFINTALPILRRDERVVGVALGGSYVKRELMDEFSGLDFVVAIDPERYDEVLAERVEIAGRLGVLLSCFTAEHIEQPERLICLYDEPPLHVDLNFQRPLDAADRYEEPVILYEKNAALSEAFATLPVKVPHPDMQWFEDRFWVWLHYAAARAGRGELFDVLGSLDFLRHNVLGPLIQMRNGQPPRGVRHIERNAPNEVARLADTIARYDRADCVRALKAAANLYIALRSSSRVGLVVREDAEKRALQYLNRMSFDK